MLDGFKANDTHKKMNEVAEERQELSVFNASNLLNSRAPEREREGERELYMKW